MTAGALGSPVFSFTSLDFSSINSDLVSFAQSTFPTDLWTDFNSSNFGTFLLQMMAYASDLLSYNANSQALETVVTTLVRTQNFINIAKTFDYTLKSATPSSGTETLTLDPSGIYPFTISPHLQFSTNSGVVFQPVAAVNVPAFVSTVTVDIIQGQEFFQEVEGQTDGSAGQSFQLANSPVIDGTLQVSVGLSSYSPVTNAIESGPSDQVYTISTDENKVTTLTFGDGVNGIIPPKNQNVVATYKIGGGSNTNVANGTITRIFGTSDGSLVPPQILSVINGVSTEDGGPAQTLTNAKQNLPLSIKANHRAVTAQDYATLVVQLVPGVLAANAVAGRPFGGSAPILLYVVPQGGGNPSDVLRNQIQVALADVKLAGKRIRVLNPVYVNLFIEQDIFVQQNSPALVVASRMRTALESKYGVDSVSFGALFGLQDAYDSVNPTEIVGINRVFYKSFTVLPYSSTYINFPPTGNGGVENITIDQDTVNRREWSIVIIPPNPPTVLVNRFFVFQRQLGVVTSVTDTLLVDTSANYTPTSLVTGGWQLRPNPDVNPVSYPSVGSGAFAITGNTSTTISVSGGLLVNVEPNDSYVVEVQEPLVGKVLRTTLTSSVSASATLPVASSSSFQNGDKVLINGTISGTVLSTGVGTITLTSPITALNGSTVDYSWTSQDGSVSFSVINGAQVIPSLTNPVSFVVGDQFFVDTYSRTGDIQIRPQSFPQLLDANVILNPIGGIQ